MAKYQQRPTVVEAVQYNGDLQPLIDFGVPKVYESGDKQIQCVVLIKNGEYLLPMGDYVVKDQFGDFSIVRGKDFAMMFEEIPE